LIVWLIMVRFGWWAVRLFIQVITNFTWTPWLIARMLIIKFTLFYWSRLPSHARIELISITITSSLSKLFVLLKALWSKMRLVLCDQRWSKWSVIWIHTGIMSLFCCPLAMTAWGFRELISFDCLTKLCIVYFAICINI